MLGHHNMALGLEEIGVVLCICTLCGIRKYKVELLVKCGPRMNRSNIDYLIYCTKV
jgi:hypothetical protein